MEMPDGYKRFHNKINKKVDNIKIMTRDMGDEIEAVNLIKEMAEALESAWDAENEITHPSKKILESSDKIHRALSKFNDWK